MSIEDDLRDVVDKLQSSIVESHAEMMAVREAAIHALSLLLNEKPSVILERIEERKRHFHDRFLKGIEDLDPGFAARIDDRDSSEISTEDEGAPPVP